MCEAEAHFLTQQGRSQTSSKTESPYNLQDTVLEIPVGRGGDLRVGKGNNGHHVEDHQRGISALYRSATGITCPAKNKL